MALHDGLGSPSDEETFERSCRHAGLAGLANRPGSWVSAEEHQAESDRAINWLCRAVALGDRHLNADRTEATLDPIRDRPDFRFLMMNRAFPTDPFARGD